MKRFLSSSFLISVAAAGVVLAQQAQSIVIVPTHQDQSPDLFTMMLNSTSANDVVIPSEVIQNKGPLLEDIGTLMTPTFSTRQSVSSIQSSTAANAQFAATPGVSFEGLGVGTSGFTLQFAPPDTTMAVGPNHIVQWVNAQFAIYDKAGNKLLGGAGFSNGNVLWTGFGGLCESTNRGDPIIAYDQAADRWVFTQFAFNVTGGAQSAPYLQCFAVSQGPNPAGPYNRYSYTFTDFNDYGKIGVWPNAYYMTYNSFAGSPAAGNNGVIVCAYDRALMISGGAATTICAPTNFYAGGAALLPADLEGKTAAPPAGLAEPGYMMRQSTAPAFRMMRFSPNFGAGTATFNNGQGGALGSFIAFNTALTRACNGAGGTCIPQPGTANQLDTLGDRLMYRLAYRNRGGSESLTVSMSEDPDGAGAQASAVRWLEIRSPGSATPTLFQNATFNPDTTNRWMPSLAMDKNGNLALGYSLSSGTVFPSIAITGRLRSEVRNQMQAETIIVNGTGSQTGTLHRWGDYSTMRVDPANDCTFWYTTEYISANGSFNWSTRIASFTFPNCQ